MRNLATTLSALDPNPRPCRAGVHAVILRQSSVQLLRRGPSIAHQASLWRPAPAHAIQAPQSWGGTRATQLRSKMHHPSRRFSLPPSRPRCASSGARRDPAEERLKLANKRLNEIEAREGGRLGVFVRDTGSGATIEHRADERFPMCSTFKLLTAAAALKRVDEGPSASSGQSPTGRAICSNTRQSPRRMSPRRHDRRRISAPRRSIGATTPLGTWSCRRSAGRQGLRNSRVRSATR